LIDPLPLDLNDGDILSTFAGFNAPILPFRPVYA
jgi:hypothetical protein